MLTRTVTVLASLGFTSTASAQECSTKTLASAVPTSTAVALNEYSYCGGTLTTRVYIENVCYNKIVTLYYSDADNKVTPMTVTRLGYSSSIPDSDYEFWGSATGDVNIDGISRLVNLTYNAIDNDKTYVQKLDLAVQPSGPAPTSPAVPKPYARPTGFSEDITYWLANVDGGQIPNAKQSMFNNIEVTDAAKGTIVAAQSYANPDYGYNWVRDSSLTMDVVATLYAHATTDQKQVYQDLFVRYATARAAEQADKTAIEGLGEPKFNLDGTSFTGPWGRPQNDGPATFAITMIEFLDAYLDNGGSMTTARNLYSSAAPKQGPLKRDLLFVASNWTSPSFDLWEEEESTHFYTRMVQHRAMKLGAAFATRSGDKKTARQLTRVATQIAATLPSFYNARRNLMLYENGPVLANKAFYKDVAVMLGAIHGYAGDGIYSFSNDQMLATAYQVATSFLPVYPIASRHRDASGGVLGIPIGRYPEDVYDGVGTSRGNPWYLTTSAMAQHFYRASTELSTAGKITVTKASLPFWQYFSPQANVASGKTYASNTKPFKRMIGSLYGWGDAFLRTVKLYTPEGGHMSEEIDRESGEAVGAIDLTWSYASLLTASFARAEASGNTVYIRNLANMRVMPNSSVMAT